VAHFDAAQVAAAALAVVGEGNSAAYVKDAVVDVAASVAPDVLTVVLPFVSLTEVSAFVAVSVVPAVDPVVSVVVSAFPAVEPVVVQAPVAVAVALVTGENISVQLVLDLIAVI
jgi:hypothetical protein